MRAVEGAGNGAMEDRNDRRALPAGRHVGGAEIMRHRNAEPAASAAPSPICTVSRAAGRCSTVWPWKPTMATPALSICSVARKGLHRLGMNAGHEGIGFRQHARPRRALGQRRALFQRLPQQGLLAVRIGPVAGRPEAGDALAIGLDQRHIDAVERGPAHQPDCPYYPHTKSLQLKSNPDLLHHRAGPVRRQAETGRATSCNP